MNTVTLSNGMVIPAVGFGGWHGVNVTDAECRDIFLSALENGYRLIDTASYYKTERGLGAAIKDFGIDRSELTIQSKVWIDEMGYESTKAAIERSLDRLQTDYIDIFLVHWPRQCAVQELIPEHHENTTVKTYSIREDWKALDLETYRAIEEAVDAGKIRAIGLSNFLPHHIRNILENCRIKPVVDQLELHVGYTQAHAAAFAKAQGIQVEAWSPLKLGAIMEEPFFLEMAMKYGVTKAQLALRFLVQCGALPIPRSANPERQRQNLQIFNFEIEPDDFDLLACMMPSWQLHEHPDFNIPPRSSDINQ